MLKSHPRDHLINCEHVWPYAPLISIDILREGVVMCVTYFCRKAVTWNLISVRKASLKYPKHENPSKITRCMVIHLVPNAG